jgi:hypothetical protein
MGERPMSEAVECQYRRCSGTVAIQAVGLDDDGTPVQLGTCNRCGRVTTILPDIEQDALPGMDATDG